MTPGHNVPSKALSFLPSLHMKGLHNRQRVNRKASDRQQRQSSVVLTTILQNAICERYTFNINHTKKTLFEREFPYLGGSAQLVIYKFPDRAILDCVAKAWARTARDLVADNSTFRSLQDLEMSCTDCCRGWKGTLLLICSIWGGSYFPKHSALSLCLSFVCLGVFGVWVFLFVVCFT